MPTSAYDATPMTRARTSSPSSTPRPARTWCGWTVAISAGPRSGSVSCSRPHSRARVVLEHVDLLPGVVQRAGLDRLEHALAQVRGPQVVDIGARVLDRRRQLDRS